MGKGLSDFIQFEDETILWTASLILLKQLSRSPKQLAGKRVLELGSGLGHLGCGLKALGAQVTCTERPQELGALQASLLKQLEAESSNKLGVLATALALFDSPQSGQQQLPTQPATVMSADSIDHTASSTQGSICSCPLEWGEAGHDRSTLSTQALGTFDIIICSELYYIERLFPDLLWTLRRFAGPDTIVHSIFIDRPFSFNFFALLSDEGCWDVEVVEGFDDLGLEAELQVHMHQFRLQPKSENVSI
mmetsp:Transcript_3816/g.6327  ORF Transcript_3816/g.6327 Transcript_3816/m.6327 type:complete len:249 (-) Transcript_3816:42-788(-)